LQGLHCYELFSRGQLVQRLRPGDDQAWLRWLAAQTAFAFQGHSGRLNVHNEARPRGARYWYAYHATSQRILKRYLGKTANLTLARLEEVATALSSERSPAALAAAQPARERLAQPQVASPHASRTCEQRVVLLSTKLAYPRLPAALVVRQRWLSDLEAALSHRLTLLSAAAGWGKTTLLASWLRRNDEHGTMNDEGSEAPIHHSSFIAYRFDVAWLSLDELDNDLTRFWIALIGTLRTCVPDAGAVALAMLQSPERAPLSAILTVLLNDLASLAAGVPILLILDDYHLMTIRPFTRA
jgi:LuxR family transcriptional regulator, maltose regulon positive regulatory protein